MVADAEEKSEYYGSRPAGCNLLSGNKRWHASALGTFTEVWIFGTMHKHFRMSVSSSLLQMQNLEQAIAQAIANEPAEPESMSPFNEHL